MTERGTIPPRPDRDPEQELEQDRDPEGKRDQGPELDQDPKRDQDRGQGLDQDSKQDPGLDQDPKQDPGPESGAKTDAEAETEAEAEQEPDDEYHLQGRRIITEEVLDEVFADDNDGLETPAPVRRRRILHGVVLTAVAVLLVAAVFTALAVSRGDLKIPGWGPVTPKAITCPTGTYEYPANDSFVLNVYNSTTEGGLARQAAGALTKRGYKVHEVGSKRMNYYGLSAVVVSGPKGEANAMNLQRNIAGTEYVADDRKDTSVDVILGSKYKELVPAKKVDKKAGTLSCPRLEESKGAPSPSPSK